MDVMNVANMAMNMSQTQLMPQVGTAVLSMSLDSMTEQGDAMVEMMNRSMMENSVNPDLGGNIDIMI